MSPAEKISVKAFWEAVEQRLAACSADELRAILRAMAQEALPAERAAFLEKLGPPGETGLTVPQAGQPEDLLADIDDLVQELKIATKNADAWEERYNEWGEYDEDSLGPYEEFVEPLVDLFDRVEAAFNDGDLDLAHAAYRELFDVLNLEDDYGRGVHLSDLTGVDMGEARARYLRTVYELEPFDRRPQVLFEQMQHLRSGLNTPRLALDDLIQVSPRPLPDRDKFLVAWIAYLRTQSGSAADAWLREAIRLSQGTAGLAALARAEGQARPRAYLDWFTALEQEGKYREVLGAAQEALQTLPAQLPIRAAIADHLGAAAIRSNETEALRAGRWEAFLAQPTLYRLLDLWETAPAAPAERTALMGQAVEHIRVYMAHPPARSSQYWPGDDGLERPVQIGQPVLAHACLLAEDFEAAYQLAAGAKVLGWSSSDNPQGLVLSFFLVLLSGKAPGTLPPNLAQLWTRTLQASIGFWSGSGTGDDQINKRLERAYTDLFARVSLSQDRQEVILAWCLGVIRQWVEAIVSGQHRASYDKAAQLTAAGAETLRLRQNRPAARALVDEIGQRFPRHRAFQTELKAALQRMERDLR